VVVLIAGSPPAVAGRHEPGVDARRTVRRARRRQPQDRPSGRGGRPSACSGTGFPRGLARRVGRIRRLLAPAGFGSSRRVAPQWRHTWTTSRAASA